MFPPGAATLLKNLCHGRLAKQIPDGQIPLASLPGGRHDMSAGRMSDHFEAHQRVVRSSIEQLAGVATAVEQALVETLMRGGKVLAFGNGGSATQASHLAGELVGRYLRTRRPLPAIALAGDAGTVTCIGNDFGYAALYERQVDALAKPGDLALGLTTSGKSENVLRGLAAAKRCGAVTVALTGGAGLAGTDADHVVRVPSTVTAHIQEVHLMLLHVWCEAVDAAFPSQLMGDNP
jgi:D-sedoheptulose 7-phosphate isomerase